MTDYTDYTFDFISHSIIPFFKQEWVIQAITTIIAAESFEALLQSGVTWLLQQIGTENVTAWTASYYSFFGTYGSGSTQCNANCPAAWLNTLYSVCNVGACQAAVYSNLFFAWTTV